MSSNQAPELPLEIWQHIVSYIPKTNIRKLYSVNRALFNHALDSKYAVALIDGSSIDRTLCVPIIRGRTRVVLIRPNHNPACGIETCHVSNHLLPPISESFEDHPKRNLNTLAEESQVIVPDPAPTPDSVTDDIQIYHDQLLQASAHMKHVQTIELRYTSPNEEHYSTKMEFAKELLAHPFNHISRLNLSCVLEGIHHVLTPEVFLPNLSSLHLSFHTFYSSSDPAELTPLLQKFLCNHRKTILELELSFSHMVSPSNFLKDLPRFPSLRSLLLKYCVISLNDSFFSGIRGFVSTHESQLHTLSIFIMPNPLYHLFSYEDLSAASASATLVNFHNLKALTMGMTPRACLPIKVKQLEQYQSTLTSLQLHQNVWTYNQLKDLFSGIKFVNLRQLAISIVVLSPRHLAYFSRTFPILKNLVLTIELRLSIHPSARTPMAPATERPFHHGLMPVFEPLSKWNLYELTVMHYMSENSASQSERYAVACALPSVEVFSGVARSEYIGGPDDPAILLRKRRDFWGLQHRDDESFSWVHGYD